jgi:heme-degrading monooxygenase HmoA
VSSPRLDLGTIQRFAVDLLNLGNLMVTSGAAQNREEAMMLRIIHGKLKPGTWDSYERAYKDIMATAGKISGLRGRWLAHASDDPDAGYTMSLWESEAAMRAYESSDILQKTILPQLKPFFSGDYTTTRCEVRFAEEFD